MFRLKAALSAVFVAAGVALAVSVFVVSVVAPSARSEENPSEGNPGEAQYSEGLDSQKEDPTGYYHFYDRWANGLGAEAPSEDAASQGSDPSARAPEAKREIMEPHTLLAGRR
jgi:hypothetical protein